MTLRKSRLSKALKDQTHIKPSVHYKLILCQISSLCENMKMSMKSPETEYVGCKIHKFIHSAHVEVYSLSTYLCVQDYLRTLILDHLFEIFMYLHAAGTVKI